MSVWHQHSNIRVSPILLATDYSGISQFDIYLEYHSVCPLVKIGTPHPSLPQTSVSPPEPNGEGAHSHAVEGVESPNSDNWRKSLVPKFIDPVFVNDRNEWFEPVFAKTGSINLGLLLCLLCRIKSANCSEPLDLSMLRALVLANH